MLRLRVELFFFFTLLFFSSCCCHQWCAKTIRVCKYLLVWTLGTPFSGETFGWYPLTVYISDVTKGPYFASGPCCGATAPIIARLSKPVFFFFFSLTYSLRLDEMLLLHLHRNLLTYVHYPIPMRAVIVLATYHLSRTTSSMACLKSKVEI